jgi:acylphosphatase
VTRPMIPAPEDKDVTAEILIFGDVTATDFPSWISRHSHKLGLHTVTTTYQNDCLKVQATGPDEMLTALAVGCSLGPATVLIDRVVFTVVP